VFFSYFDALDVGIIALVGGVYSVHIDSYYFRKIYDGLGHKFSSLLVSSSAETSFCV